MFKYVFLVSLLALAHAGLLNHHQISQPTRYAKHEEDYDHHPQYKFNYNVHDLKTGDIKDQEESRDGDHVKGSYSLVEPDGSKRIVEYSADEHSGFNAIVRKENSHHQEIHYQTISQHQPIQNAAIGLQQPIIQPAAVSFHQPIQPASIGIHQPVQPAAISLHQPIQQEAISIHQPVQQEAISIHQPVQQAAIGLHQPIQQEAISIHQPIQQATIGVHQPVQHVPISLHHPIQQATVSYQRPLIQPVIQHQEIGLQAQHGQLYTTQGLGHYGSGHLSLGTQAFSSHESGKLDLSQLGLSSQELGKQYLPPQQLISQGSGQHDLTKLDCSKFGLSSHGSSGLEQSLISPEQLHNGHQDIRYVQQEPVKFEQYQPLQIKSHLPVKIVGQYAPQLSYGHSEIKIQQHLSPSYEHGHQLSHGGQSYTDIKIDHIQTAKHQEQISNAHLGLGQSQIKYEQILQPQPSQQSYGPAEVRIEQQPQIELQSYGKIGQSDLSSYEQKIEQSSQQLPESYNSASSISSSGEASQGYVYEKPAIKFELPSKAYGAP